MSRILLPTSNPVAGAAAADSLRLPPGLVNGLPAQAAAAVTPPLNGHAMAPQLAANLLDMGLPQAVGSRAWPGALSERVLWMAQGDQQFARLSLNPPHLGPLEIRVDLKQDQASVTFLSAQPVVREALEAALPRLRELFDQQSLNLVRADVSDPGTQQGQAGDEGGTGLAGGRGGPGYAGDAEELPGAAEPLQLIAARGLVDLFA
jgi:flagellar hook-length control protein FliK